MEKEKKEALKSLAQALQQDNIEKVKWWIAAAIEDLVKTN